MNVAKTKGLITCAATAQLICVFVFAYAESRFSHEAAHSHEAVHIFYYKDKISESELKEESDTQAKVAVEKLNYPTRSVTNRAVEPQKMVRVMKF